MNDDKPNKCDRLIKLIKETELAYYCEWCKRHLAPQDGIYIHDEVYHPEDVVFDGGEHRIH